MKKKVWEKVHHYSTAACAGAAAGGSAYAVLGGVGIAAAGTAVGVTLAPFMFIGAAASAIGYGLYSAGKTAGAREPEATSPSAAS